MADMCHLFPPARRVSLLGSTTGCHELLDAVTRIQPRLHVFGHIHPAYGVFRTEHTTFVNASRLGPHDSPDKAPFVFEMTGK
jgi:Icc-related predicted phosphoesterase